MRFWILSRTICVSLICSEVSKDWEHAEDVFDPVPASRGGRKLHSPDPSFESGGRKVRPPYGFGSIKFMEGLLSI